MSDNNTDKLGQLQQLLDKCSEFQESNQLNIDKYDEKINSAIQVSEALSSISFKDVFIPRADEANKNLLNILENKASISDLIRVASGLLNNIEQMNERFAKQENLLDQLFKNQNLTKNALLDISNYLPKNDSISLKGGSFDITHSDSSLERKKRIEACKEEEKVNILELKFVGGAYETVEIDISRGYLIIGVEMREGFSEEDKYLGKCLYAGAVQVQEESGEEVNIKICEIPESDVCKGINYQYFHQLASDCEYGSLFSNINKSFNELYDNNSFCSY